MRIAIFGATSQIAQSLIPFFLEDEGYELDLYARNLEGLNSWLLQHGVCSRVSTKNFLEFSDTLSYQLIINFIGSGDPILTASLGSKIFDITLNYDDMILRYLNSHPSCRYIFLSSGAVYGDIFLEPVGLESCANLPINQLTPKNYYGAAKLLAECRHRAYSQFHITDLRVFNFFSATQNLEARFLITDILRAIRDNQQLVVSPDKITRDFLHPKDLFQLMKCVFNGAENNQAIDCYSKKPVTKFELLAEMKSQFGLDYETSGGNGIAVNATGLKSNYFSRNYEAKKIGYQPIFSSLEGIISEAKKVISNFGVSI